MQADPMTRAEIRAGASLAGVFGLRMLGLFFILPVFAVHAREYRGGENLTLVGIALGAYGLTQAILQVPFGMASDRWGRKPVIYIGLLLFAAGSFFAASAGDIWTAIAGRAMQGTGAVNSVVMALAADLTREQHRTKVMAMIGSTIGLMFAVSLVAAPLLDEWIGLAGLFALTGTLALLAIWVVWSQVPDASLPRGPAAGADRRSTLLDPQLLRLNLGIFVLHVILYAMFLVVPPLLIAAGLELSSHWKLYLPVVLASFVVMLPPILYADRRNRPKPVLLCAVALLCAVELALGALELGIAGLAAAMLGFFIAFNVLEALLPSLVSRVAPPRGRGMAIGVYNTTQTLGIFFGGLCGGWIATHFGVGGVFATCAGLACLWLAVAAGMRAVNPQAAQALYIHTVLDKGDRDGIGK
jgi:MFS family permease